MAALEAAMLPVALGLPMILLRKTAAFSNAIMYCWIQWNRVLRRRRHNTLQGRVPLAACHAALQLHGRLLRVVTLVGNQFNQHVQRRQPTGCRLRARDERVPRSGAELRGGAAGILLRGDQGCS